jgi:phosphoribosylformylglycinamidine (FGAM) synthase-like amidotransferase family enzyme
MKNYVVEVIVENKPAVRGPEGDPHPERASEVILSPSKTADGRAFFESMLDYLGGRANCQL